MNENALQLWDGVVFRQRPNFTFESIGARVQDWTGLDPQRALEAVHPADREEARRECAIFRLRHARTWQITWVEQRRRAVSDGYEGYWENVTERIRLRQQLAQAHWRATLGTATQRLVHDFNNLLTGILSLSDAYLLRVEANNPAREGLQIINQNALQAAEIAQHMGGLFREKPGTRSYQDLAQLATAGADMLRRVLPKHSAVALACGSESIPVYVDAAELKQVIVSLGLTLAPPVALEARLERKKAYLTIRGSQSEDSAAALAAEVFARRNGAEFTDQGNAYTFCFPEADFTEAEREVRSILVIESDGAFAVAEMLRRESFDVVIGGNELRRRPEYRFEKVIAVDAGTEGADLVLSARMSEQEVLAKVRESI